MESDSEMFHKLTTGLVSIFRDQTMRIILYGSVARGTQTEESDVDIAVILPSYTKDMTDRMWDLIVDLELEYDRVLSILLIDAAQFSEWEDIMPFYKNIKKDGILLWPAA